jgi:hypothetical protein
MYLLCPCVLTGILTAGCGESASQPEMVRPVRAIKVGDMNADFRRPPSTNIFRGLG